MVREAYHRPLPPQAQLGRPILLTPDTLRGDRREEKRENEKRVGEMAKIKKSMRGGENRADKTDQRAIAQRTIEQNWGHKLRYWTNLDKHH